MKHKTISLHYRQGWAQGRGALEVQRTREGSRGEPAALRECWGCSSVKCSLYNGMNIYVDVDVLFTQLEEWKELLTFQVASCYWGVAGPDILKTSWPAMCGRLRDEARYWRGNGSMLRLSWNLVTVDLSIVEKGKPKPKEIFNSGAVRLGISKELDNGIKYDISFWTCGFNRCSLCNWVCLFWSYN